MGATVGAPEGFGVVVGEPPSSVVPQPATKAKTIMNTQISEVNLFLIIISFLFLYLAVCKTQKSRTAQGFFVKYTTDFSPLLWYNLVGKKTKNHKSRRKNHAK
jgi:hypothetical protein